MLGDFNDEDTGDRKCMKIRLVITGTFKDIWRHQAREYHGEGDICILQVHARSDICIGVVILWRIGYT